MSMKNETAAGTRQSAGAELSREHSSVRSTVFVALALWLGAVVFLGSKGAFVAGADSPPLAIFIGLAIPLSVFFAAYLGWGAFRAFVLNADLRLVSALQAWRWAGLGFLSLYAHGILPGLFALPAGLGDMAIGFTAPWMVLRLIRQPSFAASRRYKVWNILGIFDFVVAFSMATLSSGFIHGLGLKVTTSAMAQLPLVLIPVFMVPFFIMLHLTALFQARQFGRSGKSTRALAADVNTGGGRVSASFGR